MLLRYASDQKTLLILKLEMEFNMSDKSPEMAFHHRLSCSPPSSQLIFLCCEHIIPSRYQSLVRHHLAYLGSTLTFSLSIYRRVLLQCDRPICTYCSMYLHK
ncbi:hypothetical protein RB195_017029 [Necator americanus]|uniref:Uncharacterized protein n=1 Tax=Necator americanus TaxID=51031 RepID=A0ABR1C5S1_NECAM